MKLNKKGYMLVEIVIATVLAFSIAFYLLNLTYKFKNTNSDIQESRAFLADRLVITKNIMNDIGDKAVGNVWTRSYLNSTNYIDSNGNEKSRGNFIRFVLIYDECTSDGSCSQKREWRQLAVKPDDKGVLTVYYGKGKLISVIGCNVWQSKAYSQECADAFDYDEEHNSYFEKKLPSVLRVKDIIDSNNFVKVDGYKISNVNALSGIESFWTNLSNFNNATDNKIDLVPENMEKVINKIEEAQNNDEFFKNVANIRTSDYYYAKLPIFSIYSDEDYGINIFAKRMYKVDFVRNVLFVDDLNKKETDSNGKTIITNNYTDLYGQVKDGTKKERANILSVNLTVDGVNFPKVKSFCGFYEAGTKLVINSVKIEDPAASGGETTIQIEDGTGKGTFTLNSETINAHGHGWWGGTNETLDSYRVVDHFFLRFYFVETSEGVFEFCENNSNCPVSTNGLGDAKIGYVVNGNVRGNNRPCITT